jgi:hypothetical protein
VCYAFTYFNAPADQQAELWVGSDESMKMYLNGAVVYNYKGTRSFTPDPNNASPSSMWIDTPIVNIKKGLNTLLVKTLQTTGRYDFSLNICEVQSDMNYRGNRIMGLKFVTTGSSSSVNDKNASIISAFELKNCYPNPFNPTTNISYTIGKRSFVSIKVFDITGREIASLVNEQKNAGTFTASWDAAHLASGIYFCRMQAKEFSAVTKMVLMK